MPAAPPAHAVACFDGRVSSLDALTSSPVAPERPSAIANSDPQPVEPAPNNIYQAPWSRVGLGADVSPLGVGMKAATVLNTFMDLRVDGNYFHYDTGRFEVDSVNIDGQLQLASAAAKVDVYPFLSVWRLSAGLMFFNSNRLYAASRIASGQNFTLSGQNFYSASPNPATGAVPVTGSGFLGMHPRQPAFVLSGGFGRFIPRSHRHWSFPSEFGVVFMGAPTVNVNVSGWVCTDSLQTRCGNLADPTNPVTVIFNNALQTTLAKWRHDANSFTLYPVFSYSAVYSFDIRQ